ncbi:MAG: STAS domain-containing protein [Acidobacteriota bacterium]|nr:STAS domain-containing protein [Acidobacteriota bacterium]
MPLEIRESREAEIVVLELVGRLDTKTSGALEKSVATHLGAGQRRFVLDLAGMEYVSSAGLRIFLMLAKKVSGGTGGLALCGLSPQVKEVFDIAGFTRLFTLAASRAEAVAGGGKAPAPAPKSAKAAAPKVEPPRAAAPSAPAESLASRAAKALGSAALAEHTVAPEVRDLAARAAALLARGAQGKSGRKNPG